MSSTPATQDDDDDDQEFCNKEQGTSFIRRKLLFPFCSLPRILLSKRLADHLNGRIRPDQQASCSIFRQTLGSLLAFSLLPVLFAPTQGFSSRASFLFGICLFDSVFSPGYSCLESLMQ